MTVDQAMAVALGHHQAGRTREAEALYRQVLVQQPKNPGALHLLGLIAWQNGQVSQAEDLIRQAVARAPAETAFLNNLAIILMQSGRADEAVGILRRVTEVVPGDFAAHFALGAALQNRTPAEAEAAYRRVLELKPDHPGACNNLGLLAKKRGQLPAAVDLLQRALVAKSEYVEALGNLADCHHELGEFEKAVECCAKALAIRPGQPALETRMAAALLELGRAEEAIAAARRALAADAGHAPAWNDLASALNLGGRLDEAEEAYRAALRLNPDLAEVYSNLAVLLESRGEIDEAIALYRRALALRPDHARIHSNLLYTLHFSSACHAHAILDEHRKWDLAHAMPLRSTFRPHANDRDPERRLRIGYVSPDLYQNVIGRFMLPLLAAHDRSRFEVYGYSAGHVSDALTTELKAHADVWRPIDRMSDDAAAEQIRADRIDVLVDLSMHMRNSRLLVFARKPAPVQMTYLAFCSTTGLSAMDYRISDFHMDPPEADTSCYTEETLRLPDCFWCYAASPEAPPVNDLSAIQGGGVTFGCLNSFSKVSPEALSAWSRILRAVPGSRLLLHAKEGRHRERVRAFLESQGIARSRCEFSGPVPIRDYFRLYHRIDIALDPFPYAGGTTTLDALWMGVPVVTLGKAKLAVGRGGVSILSNLGMGEWIARDVDEYVGLAVKRAADVPRLMQLRHELRARMQNSALMDAIRFTRGMESLYRNSWRQWAGGEPSQTR